MSTSNQFVVRFDTDNSDFEGNDTDAVAAIFAQIVKRLTRGEPAGTVRDRNGNTVGEYVWNYSTKGD